MKYDLFTKLFQLKINHQVEKVTFIKLNFYTLNDIIHFFSYKNRYHRYNGNIVHAVRLDILNAEGVKKLKFYIVKIYYYIDNYK